MLLFIRYLKSLGDSAIYTRLRDNTARFWDFVGLSWVDGLTDNCKIWLAETQDDDTVDSLYSSQAVLPAGGPWIEETVLSSTGRVLGYDYTATSIENTQMTLRQLLFAYSGNANNVFSKVCGSFVGTINFYVCSYSDFAASMNDPSNSTLVCTLASTGVMSNTTYINTDGEVLFFKLSSSFTALVSPPTVNIYSAANTGNTRVYVPLGVQYVADIAAYYPTTSGGLLVYENGNLVNLGESAYGKALAQIPNINWDRISQPVQLNTTATIV